MNWTSKVPGEPTRASDWNGLLTNLEIGHTSSGAHKGRLFPERTFLTNPHVMDTAPAACVSIVLAGSDLAFRCGATSTATIHFSNVELHSNMNLAAGLTMRVFWTPASVSGNAVHFTAAGYRLRPGVVAAAITGTNADVAVGSCVGQSTAILLNAASLAQGDILAPSITRTPGDAGDTYAGDVYVLSAQLEWTYQ